MSVSLPLSGWVAVREIKKLEPRREMMVREPNSAATVAEMVEVMVLSV